MIKNNPTQQFVDVSGTRISLYEWGEMRSGEQSIVLLHATGFHARCWDQVIHKLEARHVLAIDLRGHGDSANAPIANWKALADDVAEVLSKLGVAHALGVGHSMGGYVALFAAHLNTTLFSRLLLIDPVILPEICYQKNANPMAVPAGVEHPVARRRNEFPSPQGMFEALRKKKPYSEFDEAVLRDYCQFGLVMREDGNGYTLACPPKFEASIYQTQTRFAGIYEVISNVKIPVTVVRAQEPRTPDHYKDFQFSPTWPGLAAHLRNGRDIYLPSATHFLPLENPSQMVDLILDQLKDFQKNCPRALPGKSVKN